MVVKTFKHTGWVIFVQKPQKSKLLKWVNALHEQLHMQENLTLFL